MSCGSHFIGISKFCYFSWKIPSIFRGLFNGFKLWPLMTSILGWANNTLICIQYSVQVLYWIILVLEWYIPHSFEAFWNQFKSFELRDNTFNVFSTNIFSPSFPWITTKPKKSKEKSCLPMTLTLPTPADSSTCHLSPVTCRLSPVTCHLSPPTCHLSHVSNTNNHSQGPSPWWVAKTKNKLFFVRQFLNISEQNWLELVWNIGSGRGWIL